MAGSLDDLNFAITISTMDALQSITNLGSGLQTLSKGTRDVTSVASGLSESFRKIQFSNMTSTASGLAAVATAAGNTASVLEGMSAAADMAEQSVTAMAFSAHGANNVFTTLTPTLHKAAGGARMASGAISGTGSALRLGAGAASYLAHAVHGAMIVVSLLGSAFSVLLVPIRAVYSVGVVAFNALAFAMNTVLFPVKLLWAGFAKLASFMLTVSGVAISLAMSIFKVWFVFKGWIGALKMVASWLSMLPPKMRIIVGGLLALGAAGKVGSGALKLMSFGLRAFGAAARIAATSARVLLLPLLLIRNPMAALRSAAMLAGQAMAFAGSSAIKAANAIARVGASAGRGISAFGSMVAGVATKAAIGFGLMGIAAVAWGASTAAAGEKNDVVFGTMLKSMEQGKAVVDSLQGSQAAKLFDNEELLTSGRLLFKAGVSAADLANKTDQLATIAVATSTDLNDLARIYQQGAVTGSFGQDKINQLAERGIDIYHGLESATGKSGGELKKMISDGKIGLTEMDAALAHMTEGQGIYAGAISNVAGTTGGMLTQIKNNAQQTLGQLMGYGLGVVKPVLAFAVKVSEKIRTAVTALEPVFIQSMGLVTSVMNTAWTSISEVATGAFILIFGEATMTFDSIVTWMAKMIGAAAFIFANLGNYASIAWKSMQLGASMAFNDIIYFFTTTIPAYLGWFGENWAAVFVDAGMVVATVFSNIAKNIGSAMKAIWDFIASGGTKSLQFAFVPLLDGFKATVAELPNVPERALTQMEMQLATEINTIGENLGTGLSDAMASAAGAVGTQTEATLDTGKTGASGSESAGDKANKSVENKASLVRSSEGQSVVAQFAKAMGKGDTEKKAQKAQIDAAKDLKDIAREVVRNGKPLVAKAF